MLQPTTYKKHLFFLILISAIIRALFAALIEFGNDEVYYTLYALYPDWSHFDHPSMVGWMMQIFSLNLLFESELALRMSSIVLGSFNIWFIYKIGSALKNERTGWFAALLYTASIYAFVICGIFILPDTPQTFFWLLSLLFFIKAFKSNNEEKIQRKSMLFAGLFCGLAFLSKYTSLFLWVGVGLYILFWNRKWLFRKELYISILITIFCMFPVVIWNFQNDFISFKFHSERIVYDHSLRPDLFFSELAGELLYNNPIVVILTVIAVIIVIKQLYKEQKSKQQTKTDTENNNFLIQKEIVLFLLCTALPFILVFWIFSWQRATLPHWSAPAFLTLIPITAVWLDNKTNVLKKINGWIISSLALLLLVLVVGFGQITWGWFTLDKHKEFNKMGKDDFSLDMYGWEQLGEKFKTVREQQIEEGNMQLQDPIISYNWFPAAHLDYYVARPININVLAIGSLEKIHKYAWINKDRGGFYKEMNGWYITSSRNFKDPNESMKNYFSEIGTADTIYIYRNQKHIMNYYIYPLKNFKEEKLQELSL